MMSDFPEVIGNAVKYHRKQAGLSQKQLAQYADVGKTVIFDIEHYKKTVQLDTLLKVLHVLNIKLTINTPLVEKESNNETS